MVEHVTFVCISDSLAYLNCTATFLSILNNSNHPNSYGEIAGPVKTTLEKTIPFVRQPHSGQPVWKSDKDVLSAQSKVAHLRRSGRTAEAKEAQKELAQTYKVCQRAALNKVINTIAAAGSARKNDAVWTAVRTLTGRRRKSGITVSGDTPTAREDAIKDYFSATLNAASPKSINMSFPQCSALPSESDFNVTPITVDEIMQQAIQTPGGKCAGPDGVPAEV